MCLSSYLPTQLQRGLKQREVQKIQCQQDREGQRVKTTERTATNRTVNGMSTRLNSKEVEERDMRRAQFNGIKTTSSI